MNTSAGPHARPELFSLRPLRVRPFSPPSREHAHPAPTRPPRLPKRAPDSPREQGAPEALPRPGEAAGGAGRAMSRPAGCPPGGGGEAGGAGARARPLTPRGPPEATTPNNNTPRGNTRRKTHQEKYEKSCVFDRRRGKTLKGFLPPVSRGPGATGAPKGGGRPRASSNPKKATLNLYHLA